MTLYLAKRVVDGAVDETTTVYLGRCEFPDCRYLADHVASEVVEDALDGHRRRAHDAFIRQDAAGERTSWLSFPPPHPTEAPRWAPANDPHLPPSPTPREES